MARLTDIKTLAKQTETFRLMLDTLKSRIDLFEMMLNEYAETIEKTSAVDGVSREEHDLLVRRLEHLLESNYIASFDEKKVLTGEYKRDIREADAVPVVHGRWIDDCTYIVCSVCKAVYSDEIVFMNRDFQCDDLKFCPNCGSKMDGGVSNATD